MLGIGSNYLEWLQSMPQLNAGQLLGAIFGAVAIAMAGSGGFVLMMLDPSIDLKYATDEDVTIVRLAVQSNEREIQETKETVEDTQQSVHDLALVVLNSEIRRTESSIRELEAKETLTNQEREYLATLRRQLRDLQIERERIFERTMNER